MKDTGCDLGSAYHALARLSGGGVVGGEGDFFLESFSSS